MDNNPRSVQMYLQEEKVVVPSTDKVSLEARLYRGTQRKHTCIVLTHPYGPLGGNLDNNVVKALFNNFASQGFMTVRFNFRGSGRSTGRASWKGQGEADDVLAICNYVRSKKEIAPQNIVLCGYSYGSVAAGAITRQVPELAGFISISYPSGVLWFLTFFGSNKLKQQLCEIPSTVPKLFISGTKDSFTSEANFQKFIAELPAENRSVVSVTDATHFWQNQENLVVAHVNQWMGRTGLNAKSMKAATAAALKISPAVTATRGLPSPISPASPWTPADDDR
ncbi:hypothetical protein HDU88_007916 [Geranomyces variabilis]|nr:hypothetical protein HDU88_007916 [Geranomyces variabilis]